MSLPIYELKIKDNMQDDAEVSFIALVDEPAIKKDFLAFRDEFVSPTKGEDKDHFIQRCMSYVVGEGKDKDQAYAICESMWSQHFADSSCPIATQDIKTNLANRQKAIDIAHYGPLNPNLPSEEYWIRKGKQFNTTPDEAKKSTCSNCSFFNVSKMIKDCIAKGIGNELDPYDVVNAGDLGYCEAFDFKCASKRTCDAWVVGGPIEMKKQGHKFSIVNEEQRIISGPLMLADELIYRNNERFGEHYVKFSADTIKQIAIKFAKKKYQANVNLMHDPNMKVTGVTMFESWLVDKSRGIKAMSEFSDVVDGSWFGSFYVENDEVWKGIKQGVFKGFSVEGMFDYEQPISAEENALKKISQLLNELND